MFGWLASWFRDRDDIYSPKERLIFSYFNGERAVKADPQVLWERLMAVGLGLSIDIKVGTSIHPDSAKARTNAVATVRDIFKLAPLVGGLEVEGTLSDSEACDLLDRFMLWAESLKKNSSLLATLPGEGLPTSGLPSAGSLPMPNGSDSGSIGNGRGTETPGPLPMESPSPSAQ